MRYALVLACLTLATLTANAQYHVRNNCSPAFAVTNKCGPAADPSCVCGAGCSCAAGTCPACPTAATAGALRTASGRLIRQTATGWVYADEVAVPVTASLAAPTVGSCAGGSCSGGSCGVPTAVGRGYARGLRR